MTKGNTETLLMGAGLAAAGVFAWMHRQALIAGLAPAGSTPGSLLATGAVASGGGGSTSVLTAPVPLPMNLVTYTSAPATGLTSLPSLTLQSPTIQTPYGPVTPSNLNPAAQGCVVGAQGGLYCPNAPAAVVLTAQTDACLPPSQQELQSAMARKPTWSADYAATRLAQLRAAYCAGKQNLAAAKAGGDMVSTANWTSAIQGNAADYFNLTGVQLS
jgi:hypothetical protein